MLATTPDMGTASVRNDISNYRSPDERPQGRDIRGAPSRCALLPGIASRVRATCYLLLARPCYLLRRGSIVSPEDSAVGGNGFEHFTLLKFGPFVAKALPV